MKIHSLVHNRYATGALFLTVATVTQALAIGNAHAAFASTFVRFDRMKVSTQTTGTVCANPNTTGTESTVSVTFPTGYTVGTASNFTVNTTNNAWPTGGTAWVGIGTPASSVSGQTVTWSSGDLTVGTLYCFNWTNAAAVTQPSSPGNNQTGTVATNLESGQYATSTVSNDQVVVTATVPAAFSFALSTNTDPIVNLTSSTIGASTTPPTATVNTNARNGWSVWAKNNNGTLSSATAAYSINSSSLGANTTLAAGTEGYVLGVTTAQTGGTGTPAATTAFANGGTSGRGSGLDSSLRTIVTSGGSANNAVMTLKNYVTINAITPAAIDYTDTQTYIGAALF